MVYKLRRFAAVPIALVILWFAGSMCSAAVDTAALALGIDALLADPCLDHGIQGVVVRSLVTGETLYEHGADLAMMPASNQKLLTSAAALVRLGPDFTTTTQVLAHGDVGADGVLRGDLIIKGGGDVILDTDGLRELARRVKDSGISKVSGDVVADDSAFDDQRLGWGWSWDYESDYYAAQISALSLNRNTVDIYVYPGKTAGQPAVIRCVPPTNLVSFRSSAATGKAGSKKTIEFYRERGHNTIHISGSIPADAQVKQREGLVTVDQPHLYAADVFKTELARLGTRVMGSVRSGTIPEDAAVIAERSSPPLSRVIELLNKPSDNLIAEVMLKTLGLSDRGRGTTAAGVEAALAVFEQAGMDASSVRMVDGSGLSRLNLVTARNIAALLVYMHGSPYFDAFVNSLPVAGVDGTLRNRMKGTAAANNVKAKTGYVGRVSSLSGYVSTKSGEQLAFSILMNHHLCSNSEACGVQNRICELLAGLP